MCPKPLYPTDLKSLIVERISRDGYACDLNDIDISGVTDFTQLFKGVRFHGDISKWNVSHVTSMHEMFCRSEFNGDISKWDTSSVTDMAFMFERSQFAQDIGNWDVRRVKTMRGMFLHSPFNQSLAAWDVSGVEDFSQMFFESPYEKDLNAWNPKSARDMETMLYDSAYQGQISNWRVPPDCNTNLLINARTFEHMREPSFFHFQMIYGENARIEDQMWPFVQEHREVLQSMGLTPTQAGVWLHAQWYDGLTLVESLPIPEEALDISIE